MANLTSLTINDTGFIKIPVGTTAQRPASPQTGMIRYNTDEEYVELYNGEEWTPISNTASALYEFTNATFTSGGVSGRTGPSLTQARSGLTGTGVDAWKNNTQYFNTSNGIQLWTVPKNGTYRIETWGAQGGDNTASYSGGFGARMRGDFTLTQGEVIKILVGQIGGTSYGGGGGGTFVAQSNNTPLIVSGGGNTRSPWNSTIVHATTATSGTGGSVPSYNGVSGSGGNATGSSAAGGAGFTGNGTNTSCGSSVAPLSFVNGGTGGQTCNSIGGFGGGSASDGCCQGASGAGGGYSGGAGCSSSSQYGGAGGSFNNGTNQSNDNGNSGTATLTGNGRVIITAL